jgi:ATP-dependent DNA ligase
MPGFVRPQLASLRTKPPVGEYWLHEIKYDGYRLQIHLDNGRVTIRTRTGLDWTKRFSAIAAAFDIPVERAIFDGEVVVVIRASAIRCLHAGHIGRSFVGLINTLPQSALAVCEIDDSRPDLRRTA